MCGIAGVFHYEDPARPVDVPVLRAMTESLAHRGPDGDGIWHRPGVGLGHRRLKIIDLSENARQPMLGASGQCVITFNGEIYNFRELRERLEATGHTFRSGSDTEVILAGYEQWGTDVVQELSGIYAFAIWDGERRRMFLARDPIGVKPLFYCVVGGTLRFGSEIKAILSDPAVDRGFDEEAIDAFLTFSYTPAPATGFRTIRQLLPGHCAIVDERGLRTWRHGALPYREQADARPFDQALAEFTERLDRITKAQMVSDVPVGAFLSGGLDSAAIVRAMKRAGTGEVHALTVGFDEPGFDEREGARATASSLGVALEEQALRMDAADLLPALSRHMEEPTADSSMLPVYLLCKAARQRFTVAMSGDGADEILAGYETYRATAMAAHYRRLPSFVRRGLLEPLARRLPVSDGKYGLHQVATRFAHGASLGAGRDHAAWRLIFSDGMKHRLYAKPFRRRTAHCDPLGLYAAHIGAVPAGREPLAGLLNADTEFYLPNDMLIKVDRMSMAHGLEVRVPFLDIEMVGYCANLPGAYKLHRGKRRKHILRESLRGSLPDEVLDRRKSGFNIPVERWMRGSLRSLMLDVITTRRHEMSAFLDVGELQRAAEEHRDRKADHGHLLFAVMMLGLWFDNAATCWKQGPREDPCHTRQSARLSA
jgi:asparagine synthase (glutamine-hydrolysing)